MERLRIRPYRTELLPHYKSRNKYLKQGVAPNAKLDKIEISKEGKKRVSQAEKIANRRKIDFADGAVGYDHNSRVFILPDGSRISADDVSTEIGDDEYKTIQADDNKLELEPGNYYRLVGKNGDITTFSCAKHGMCPYSITKDMLEEVPISIKDHNKIDLLDCIADHGNTIAAASLNSREWAVNTLKDFGFTPGKISIHINGGNCGDCYFGRDNRLYSIAGTQSLIYGMNHMNYLEHGAPMGAVWRIEGKEYPMDEKGHFHIPMDAMCVPGSMEMVDADGNPVVLHNPDA